ncbi:acetate/propionate family kinase [Kaistella flava (ex Peng et al. 2021)]|uniref:Acetate kinase n=1 Tax=Kaistella flava (ex Peng et al. 2021) TaxID=2038776 RepID=A0A7M2YCP6_9FLAO|nr:acetate/propionate family kinase [Kaistella flava (ex Peng et al. 2021)]QOW11820.1 acetate/propionate family kinase [Kaistella flava (ex Peng et al. 2021)]
MILTINGGSSSIKFSLYKINESLQKMLFGEIENIGTAKAKLNFTIIADQQKKSLPIDAKDHSHAANHLIDWLEKEQDFTSVKAIGHRIVHGMEHTEPELITDELLTELKKISAFDPEHLPEEIKLIEIFKKRYPKIKQIVCFDTAFHTSMPLVAKLLSIPRRYYEKGIRRYGFHGLSYTYLMEELKRLTDEETANSKIILAHLGSGASLAAVKNGKSLDTSMGFTPTSGLPMSTRTGDLDPGVAWYLMKEENMTAKEFNHLINQESGLLGISETSGDMRELMNVEDTDSRAAEAIDLFCYQTKKWIGSFTAVLEGLDVLVFSGGIGEHAPEVRSKICDGLEFLGIELDEINNMNNRTIISTEKSKVKVFVIQTNEELMIAKLVNGLLNSSVKSENFIK